MSARDIDIWDFQDCSGRMLSGGSGLNAKATFQEQEERERKREILTKTGKSVFKKIFCESYISVFCLLGP